MTVPGLEPEQGFLGVIIETARWYHWLAYHPYRSRQSEPGYVDLTLVKPPSVIFAEVKTATGKVRTRRTATRRGRVLPSQDDWLQALAQCPGVTVCVWRPEDWEAIVERLRNTV